MHFHQSAIVADLKMVMVGDFHSLEKVRNGAPLDFDPGSCVS